ncbi:MAG: cache domain-containing protein [Xanthomonadaceae bacterium]|nr:cache domain-containing protein [Xanthomonadaceae bacterium]
MKWRLINPNAPLATQIATLSAGLVLVTALLVILVYHLSIKDLLVSQEMEMLRNQNALLIPDIIDISDELKGDVQRIAAETRNQSGNTESFELVVKKIFQNSRHFDEAVLIKWNKDKPEFRAGLAFDKNKWIKTKRLAGIELIKNKDIEVSPPTFDEGGVPVLRAQKSIYSARGESKYSVLLQIKLIPKMFPIANKLGQKISLLLTDSKGRYLYRSVDELEDGFLTKDYPTITDFFTSQSVSRTLIADTPRG